MSALHGRPTYGDLASGDEATWRAARVWAALDPQVREDMRSVRDGYAALESMMSDERVTDVDDRPFDVQLQRPVTTRRPGSTTMNALIRSGRYR